MPDQNFSGPLFIVACFRSGTSLLCTLLNEHPRIAIPVTETNFMASLVRDFGDPPRLHSAERLDAFYRRLSGTSFFDWRQRQGIVLSKRELSTRADLNSWASIFESILKFYAPKEITDHMIWGDRSPGHLTAMKLIKSIYPAAKFLHIIRDPRDVCLSAKKVWGKSLYRTAELWRERVAAARRTGVTLGGDYQEVLYESLLNDPVGTLQAVCDYLKVDFTPAMLRFSIAHTSRGDTRGAREIVRENREKYRTELSPGTVRRIEELVYPTAVAAGYKPEYARGFKPLRPVGKSLLLCNDGAMMVRRYVKDKGGVWAAKYLVRQTLRTIRSSAS